MKVLTIEPHYPPSLEFMCLLQQVDQVCFLPAERYKKQTYRNRCHILGPQGIQVLGVPVTCSNGAPIRDATVDYKQSWVKDHKGAIRAAYGKAPYFDFFYETFEQVWDKRPRQLIELNHAMLSACLSLLQWHIDIVEQVPDDAEKVIRLNDRLEAKKDYRMRSFYLPNPYIQVFGSEFVANLSVVDVLLCCGPEASRIIQGSIAERL